MAVQIQSRRDTAANWTTNDPTLAAGEIGVETDTYKFKIGDGATAWTSLDYHTHKLNDIENPDASKVFSLGNNKTLSFTSVDHTPVADEGIINMEAKGAFSGSLLHIHQHTGNPGATELVTIETEDADVLPLKITSANAYGINLNTSKIQNVVDPTADQDVATKKYVDDNFLSLTGGTITGEVIHTAADSKYNDNYGTVFGTGYDAQIYYNNANLVIDPALEGSGKVLIGVTGDRDLECANLTVGDITVSGTVDGIDIATDVAANTAKDTNVTTNLNLGAVNATTMIVASSDGTDATLIEADTTDAGLLGSDKWDEIVANSLKTSYTKTNVKGHIEHGATNDLTRPSGFTSVEWIGTVEPTTAVNGDTWIDTS